MPENSAAAVSARSVLVVDDEPALRSLAGMLLEELGYTALLADSGRAAVQLLLQDPQAIDLVLLDLMMPGMPPEETFRLLTEIRPGLPVVILSGDPEATVRQRFASNTIAGYMQKPYTDVELEAQLAQALPCTSSPGPGPAGFRLVRASDEEQDRAKRDYLAGCTRELPAIFNFLAAQDFQALQEVGHRLKGSGGCFGFGEITQIAKELEASAEASNAANCGLQISLLKRCLEELCEKYR